MLLEIIAIWLILTSQIMVKSDYFMSLESSKNQVIDDVIWVIQGLLVLTGSRYRPRYNLGSLII